MENKFTSGVLVRVALTNPNEMKASLESSYSEIMARLAINAHGDVISMFGSSIKLKPEIIFSDTIRVRFELVSVVVDNGAYDITYKYIA